MEALATAIDAKDKYTRGHSARVAEYSRRIAEKAGKSKEECDEIYYTALLHDVGKIGIPESIINKKGRLTDEEFEIIKQHPVLGAKILENIKDSPYLSIGAHYHHERYDGKGYPDHLKGKEIPEIARIVSVADALDGQVHSNENEIRDMVYFEYGGIWFDGSTKVSGARKMQTNTINKGNGKRGEYRIETARIKDHAMIRIVGEKQTKEVIIALPDSTRFAYISLTGEHCCITNIRIKKTDTEINAEQIPRIAEEISYINAPAGDIPNVQVDGYRTAASQGIPIEDGMQITFHSISLLTARLVWHCPFLNVFGADDGRVYTENGGVAVKATAEITNENPTIFAALTGDQVAITNIRIKKKHG